MSGPKQLIIIAGLPCSGKSWLMDLLRRGECQYVARKLGTTDPSSWQFLLAPNVLHGRKPIQDRVIVHYDFYFNRNGDHQYQYIHELIEKAGNTKILTMEVSSLVLLKRARKRVWLYYLAFFRYQKNYRKFFRRLVYYRKLIPLYSNNAATENLYRSWFNTIEGFSLSSSWLLDYHRDADEPVDAYEIIER